MTNKVEAIRNSKSLRIYINKILHVEILMNNHDGLQSWLEGNKKYMYCIEFYRKEGNSILLEYDDRELWETILNLIDNNL